jgi:hypothetical protein
MILVYINDLGCKEFTILDRSKSDLLFENNSGDELGEFGLHPDSFCIKI